MIRFRHPECRDRTAESTCEELGMFSLTVLVKEGKSKRRKFSNFVLLIRLLRVMVKGKSGGISRNQTGLGVF